MLFTNKLQTLGKLKDDKDNKMLTIVTENQENSTVVVRRLYKETYQMTKGFSASK